MQLYLIAVLAVILSACASAPDRSVLSKTGEFETSWEEQGESSKYLYARGMGAADAKLTNETQKKALARNAAIVNGQYNMLSVVRGAMLTGGINVQAAMEKDSKLGTHIQSLIRGAQVTRTQWSNDSGCVVSLRLPKSSLKAAGLQLRE
jgi:hypothetical protein